eukprot:XP_766431.1 hypothetical protein [Theileria parva strain Muguga]
MDSSFNSFQYASNSFKRPNIPSENNDISEEYLENKPKRTFGFFSASKLDTNNPQNDDSSFLKTYKPDENLLNSHWLFSDESPLNQVSNTNSITHLNNNTLNSFNQTSIATTRATSIETPTGFKLASGKQCNYFNPEKTEEFRKLLGLDDVDVTVDSLKPAVPRFTNANNMTPESNQNFNVNPNLKPEQTFRQNTSVYEDSNSDSNSNAETISDLPSQDSGKLSYTDVWNLHCTFTHYYSSNMSLEVISKLWRKYGNPFLVNYSNAEQYSYLLFTHQNDHVTVGGFNEIVSCFKKIVSKSNINLRRHVYDDSWLRDKFKLLTLISCKRYTKKIYKLCKTRDLMYSVMNVPLPNPINLIRKLIRLVKTGNSHNDSILTRIFNRDSTPDIPVVVRVESYDGIDVYLFDGAEVYRGVLSDNHIKSAFESKKVRPGSKLLLQGVIFNEIKDEFVLLLNFNSISIASKRSLGIQPKHTNVIIKDLVVGGGRVSRVEVVVLKYLPLVYKIWYKCPETCEKKCLTLSENEYIQITQNPESKILGTIESISTVYTMYVVDALVLNENAPLNQHKFLLKSFLTITLNNVDDSISYVLRPLTRFVLTNTMITYHTNIDFFYDNQLDFEPVKLSSTPHSKLDVLESNVKFPENLVDRCEIFRSILKKCPSLSVPEDISEDEYFERIKNKSEKPRLFLGQICDLNGVVLHVEELEESPKYCYFRVYMSTTMLNIVCVKISYKNVNDQKSKFSITPDIKTLHKRLNEAHVAVASSGSGPDSPTKGTYPSIFYTLSNLQYVGLDEQYSIYNFQMNSDQVIIS